MLVDDAFALPKGSSLQQYEILRVLGSGGFGITYLARDKTLDSQVAIKEYLPNDFAVRKADGQVSPKSTTVADEFSWGLGRFLDEARVLAKFRHPNIVRIFQIFELNGTAYIVMEYVEGEPLSDTLSRENTFDEAATKTVLLPVMDGLKRIHQQGFLHRDIKPSNILLRLDEGPVLIDFGAAREAVETKSRSITSIVTEGYAPLEQYHPDGNQGPWTDIHALGAVAYKCLTGRTPPSATSRVRKDPLVPIAKAAVKPVSAAFAAAVDWALAVYEENRPQTIDEFAKALSGGMPSPGPVCDDKKTQMLPRTSRPAPDNVTQYLPRTRSSASAAPSPLPSPVAKRRLTVMIASAAAATLLLAGGGTAWWLTTGVARDDRVAWDSAISADSLPALDRYLRDEPSGAHVAEARRRTDELRSDTDLAWTAAIRDGSASALQRFLAQYKKNALHVTDAQSALQRRQVSSLSAAATERPANTQFAPATPQQAPPPPPAATVAQTSNAQAAALPGSAASGSSAAAAPTADALPTFDCQRARYVDEATICQNHGLTVLDRRMNEAYRALRERQPDRHVPANALAYARAALLQRHQCGGNVSCINEVLLDEKNYYERYGNGG